MLNPDFQKAAATVWFSTVNKAMESGLFPRVRVEKKFQLKNASVVGMSSHSLAGRLAPGEQGLIGVPHSSSLGPE